MSAAGAAPPRVWTIPPGANFLGSLADALIADRFGFGLAALDDDPMALAAVTIYLPTRRAARVLRSEIADRLGKGSAILPVIRALGETDEDSGFFDEATPASLDLDPPIGGTDAVLLLSDLVNAWKQALPRAILDHLDGAPIMAPANPADAVWLAQSLGDLIQSVEAEEADFDGLDGVVAADLQEWWQITLEFLKIARVYWPAALAERRRSSPARHHNVLIDAETRRIAEGRHQGPVLVAGSTGTRSSTARLIAAIARHSQGAVVLPGLDQAMAREHWDLLAKLAMQAGGAPSEALAAATIRSHPQYGLYRLTAQLGLDLASLHDVPVLATPGPALASRNALVSLALLPASATGVWAEPGALPAEAAIRTGLEGVSLIEAANEREEAAALAAAMRAALEPRDGNPEPTVALVTPDRNLARRVVIELGRYRIAANDSAGTRLLATGPGSLARLILEVAFSPGDPVALAALIKHPLARFGLPDDAARRAGELVELIALRGGTGEADVAALGELVETRASRRSDRHAPRWLARIDDGEVEIAANHAAAITHAFRPLTDLLFVASGDTVTAEIPVSILAAATAAALERTVADGGDGAAAVWADEAGAALAAILVDCRDTSSGLAMTGYEWIGAFEALASGQVVKPDTGGHPRAFVWGALEARLQEVDTILLGSLNEGTWPAPGKEDPFLSRAMKAAIGLEPPERRIGQAAHDVQMAMGAPTVILSRALRAGKSPTVASRWLQRLTATAGKTISAEMLARGAAILDFVRRREDQDGTTSPGRPEPFPPADKQPTSYSFSEVTKLRRDPYAIYARRILGLDPMEPFIREPGPRERGTLYHKILEDFVRDADAADLTEARLIEIADRHFLDAGYPEEIRAVWRNRFARFAPILARWEEERAPGVERRFIEVRGKLDLPGGLGLRGSADRIDILADGSAALIDYKTGGAPSVKQARTLIDPQLALEAHVLIHGGFDAVGRREPSELLYLRMTGRDDFADRIDRDKPGDKGEDHTAAGLAAKAAAELAALAEALKSGRRGFKSRVIAKSARDFAGDYDHLARVAEWQTADDDGGGGDE